MIWGSATGAMGRKYRDTELREQARVYREMADNMLERAREVEAMTEEERRRYRLSSEKWRRSWQNSPSREDLLEEADDLEMRAKYLREQASKLDDEGAA
jgi:hypothetical protein